MNLVFWAWFLLSPGGKYMPRRRKNDDLFWIRAVTAIAMLLIGLSILSPNFRNAVAGIGIIVFALAVILVVGILIYATLKNKRKRIQSRNLFPVASGVSWSGKRKDNFRPFVVAGDAASDRAFSSIGRIRFSAKMPAPTGFRIQASLWRVNRKWTVATNTEPRHFRLRKCERTLKKIRPVRPYAHFARLRKIVQISP